MADTGSRDKEPARREVADRHDDEIAVERSSGDRKPHAERVDRSGVAQEERSFRGQFRAATQPSHPLVPGLGNERSKVQAAGTDEAHLLHEPERSVTLRRWAARLEPTASPTHFGRRPLVGRCFRRPQGLGQRAGKPVEDGVYLNGVSEMEGSLSNVCSEEEARATDTAESRDRATRQDDPRFSLPLYTVADAALYLKIPRRTLGYWASPARNRPPVVTVLGEPHPHRPVMPFVGFSEAYVGSVFRRVHGLSWQYIRKALNRIQERIGLEHALASKQLYTDGAKILYDYAMKEDETRLLVEVVSHNAVFTEVVKDYLKRIEYARDGFAEHIILPTPRPLAAVTPYKAYGQPLTLKGDARVVDILDRFEGNESFEDIAEDFGLPEEDVEDLVRAFYQAA